MKQCEHKNSIKKDGYWYCPDCKEMWNYEMKQDTSNNMEKCKKCGTKMVTAHAMTYKNKTGVEHTDEYILICPKCFEDEIKKEK